MKKTLNDDRKKEEFGDIRARDRLKEQSGLKKINTIGPQVRQFLSLSFLEIHVDQKIV